VVLLRISNAVEADDSPSIALPHGTIRKLNVLADRHLPFIDSQPIACIPAVTTVPRRLENSDVPPPEIPARTFTAPLACKLALLPVAFIH
jgi:hypothetical protein